MITEELGLSIDVPTMVVWEALSKSLHLRPTVEHFDTVSMRTIEFYSALYLMYQLVGELILEAESKGERIFDDGSHLECMEVDSQYTYDDGCCIFSRFGLNLQSTTGQSVTINDWCDESDEPIASVLAFLGIPRST